MKSHRHITLPAAWLLAAIVGMLGCEDHSKLLNSAPNGLAIFKERCYVWRLGMVRLTAYAGDVDNDIVSYRWEVSGGTLSPSSGEGRTVFWTAPDETGTFAIRMYATDSFDEVSIRDSIVVCESFPLNISSSLTVRDEGFYISRNAEPVLVPGGATLTIGAGVVIVVDSPDGGFNVAGRLVAAGTPGKRARFIPNACGNHEGEWSGIIFSNFATGEFCNAEVASARYGILARLDASVEIDSSFIVYSGNVGVSSLDSAQVAIRNSTIWENTVGVEAINAGLSMEKSSIRFSGSDNVRVQVFEHDWPITIEGCTIANAYQNGIVVRERARPEIHHCAFYSNGTPLFGGYAVFLGAYMLVDSVNVQENFWGLDYTTESAIRQLIYDRNNNPEAIMAYVDVSPWLTSEPLCADARDGTGAGSRASAARETLPRAKGKKESWAR